MVTSEQLIFLFIHGAGGTQSKWRKVREQLVEVNSDFIDLPGHGTNDGHPAASIGEYANILSQSIHQDTIIVGHSMGGLIGIELAAKNKNGYPSPHLGVFGAKRGSGLVIGYLSTKYLLREYWQQATAV